MAKSRSSHMAERKSHGVSYRKLAGEFGTSKSQAHRIVKAEASQGRQAMIARGVTETKPDMLRDGFVRGGKA